MMLLSCKCKAPNSILNKYGVRKGKEFNYSENGPVIISIFHISCTNTRRSTDTNTSVQVLVSCYN
jgi:hypothetical protein